MRWPWRPRAKPIDPRLAADLKVLELQTAKEILAEIFGTRPSEVEKMIKSRLEERSRLEESSWPVEEETWQKEREEGQWPATFCMGE